MKTILSTAYAVNPYKGSEDGMGWNFVYQIARFNRVIAVTRENNRPAIERYMAEHPDPVYANIRYLYYDLPRHLRWWKRGSRGAMLYYLLWQRGIVDFVRRQGLEFDVAHNLNFHNDWTPSRLWSLGKPFVWGPIGHHPRIPAIFNRTMPLADRCKNLLTWSVKNYFWKWSPALRKTKERADYIWCMNDSVPDTLGLANQPHQVFPNVGNQDYGWAPDVPAGPPHILFAGRLVHMKGPDLAVEAFAAYRKRYPDTGATLTLVGDGPEKARLRTLIAQRGLSDSVRLIDWIERDRLMEMMQSASVFLFPSHEGAGMVVPEALSFGVPVITLENCGPGRFVDASCGVVVAGDTYQEVVDGLAGGLEKILHAGPDYRLLRQAARDKFLTRFHWDKKGDILRAIYASL
ncbi:glycosyltransferase involved in cell wall biosynthesis [Neolewinella xylanilytica]|uniref:Glycosyltransferase involved in cell wall biosynthesis n=1 Tax=Neolewinella xylanilytica TaxID=1514080 RepID=A0A2S6I8M1_9BACT|nr:glycosyltransferase [Neolewinella xylanilytica]PPK87828.1 glycosyltransferase involved in cell wall biosynthesis [Neolewinella xylanilytica]